MQKKRGYYLDKPHPKTIFPLRENPSIYRKKQMVTDTSTNGSQGEENGQATEAAEEASKEATAPSELEDLKAKLQDSEKKYLYLYSEFENFRRRAERDRLDFIKFGHEGFLRELLQVSDNFERAVQHAKGMNPEKGSPLAQVTQGIEMIQYQFQEALKNQGVASVSSLNQKFDPNLHEAVADEEGDAEPGTILREEQKGFTLHGRLLRPARVVVAKKN
jgi:molecular chaperone GrpE